MHQQWDAPTPYAAAAATIAHHPPVPLDITANCPIAITLAARLRESRLDLTARWLDRITARVTLDPNKVFPTDELLDHVPLLIDGIADYLEDPSRSIAADMPVVAKARELGALRFEQGFDEYEILKEYELFGGILFNFVARTVETLGHEDCGRAELLVCAHRIFQGVGLIQQATITHFLQLTKDRLKEREERLRGFNRAITHELKNQIGAVMGAMELLDELPDLGAQERARLVAVVRRNASSMRAVLANLSELTRLEQDTRRQRHIPLEHAAREVCRQLRDHAEAREVAVRIRTLPSVEVSAAAIELSLSNFVSNAIKYADPNKDTRWVEVSGETRPGPDGIPCETVVRVRDNGVGVPAEERERLFNRFFRATSGTITGAEGTGLGLSIVRDTVESLGGRAWAEFPDEGGSVFAFSLPCRRSGDRGTEESGTQA